MPTLPWVRSRICVGAGLGLALREGWVDMSPETWMDPSAPAIALALAACTHGEHRMQKPVNTTTPSNSVHSCLTVAKPIPRLPPVTWKMNGSPPQNIAIIKQNTERSYDSSGLIRLAHSPKSPTTKTTALVIFLAICNHPVLSLSSTFSTPLL